MRRSSRFPDIFKVIYNFYSENSDLPAADSLLLKLQAADEHAVQLVDVVTGLYRDAHP